MTPTAGCVNLYTTRAHVFQINPETKTSWLAKGDSAIPISLVLSQSSPMAGSNSKRELKMIGMTDNGDVALDCVISWETAFNKRSQKFVQWPDLSGTVYGLGFDSETDLNDFIEVFMDLRQKALSNTVNGVDRQPINWSSYQQHPRAEINGRATIESNSGRVSNASISAQYSNTSGYTVDNSLQKEQRASDNSGLNDNAKHPSRSQSSVGHQTNRSANVMKEGNGTVSSGDRSSPNAEETPARDEHQILDQLKYENERLKQALEESSKSASLWQSELMNLRTNNVKLTQALQESKAHVEEWEKELLNLRDENKDLKLRLMALETMSDSSKGNEYKVELQKYKSYIDELQSELRRKENKVEDLQSSLEKLEMNTNNNKQNDDSNPEVLLKNSDFRQKVGAVYTKLEASTNDLANVQKEFVQLLEQFRE